MARLHKTLTDYVVIAISPALIIMLIGSLVYFLLEVFYRGQYPLRLHWIFGLFVMATVLIGRISIEEGREHAVLFAVPLAIVTLLAVSKFVEFGGSLAGVSMAINVGLVALIWWCADRLTWDCTVIDEREDASGQGLLQTVGLDRPAEPRSTPEPPRSQEDLEATTGGEPGPAGLWQKFVEHRRRPHAPGVWVVYFSLAALPLFGIGQRFIPEANVDARRRAFWLLCVYVASGLGLLLTTSFLGLRRYLRQRRLEMPVEMAGVWLVVGVVMIVGLLVLCAALPRPSPEYSITQLDFQLDSPDDLQASRRGIGPEGARDDRREARIGTSAQEDEDAARGAPKASRNGQRSRDEGGSGPTQADDGSSSGRGHAPKGRQQGRAGPQDGNQSDGRQGEDGGTDRRQGKAGSEHAEQRSGRNGRQRSQSARQDTSSGDAAGQQRRRAASGSADRETEAGRDASGRRSEDAGRAPSEAFHPTQLANKLLGGVPYLLKLLYYLIFFGIVGYFVWRYRKEVWAAITGFVQALREFWENLFGRRSVRQEAEETAVAEEAPRPRAFAEFSDPFASGLARRLTPQQLVVYTFEALEAWAREHGCQRGPDQTPHEFAGHVAFQGGAVGREARTLADLYCMAAYSTDRLSAAHVGCLQRLWQALCRQQQAAAQPVAPGIPSG